MSWLIIVWLIEGGAAEWQTIPKLCEGDAEAVDGFQDLQNGGETSQVPGKNQESPSPTQPQISHFISWLGLLLRVFSPF